MHDRRYMYYKWQLNFPTCSISFRIMFINITSTHNILINILSGKFTIIYLQDSLKGNKILFNTFLFIVISAMRCYSKIVTDLLLCCVQCRETKDKRNINFHKLHTKLT